MDWRITNNPIGCAIIDKIRTFWLSKTAWWLSDNNLMIAGRQPEDFLNNSNFLFPLITISLWFFFFSINRRKYYAFWQYLNTTSTKFWPHFFLWDNSITSRRECVGRLRSAAEHCTGTTTYLGKFLRWILCFSNGSL